MNLFAGFWVDGAVRQPTDDHAVYRDDLVFVRWKDESDVGTACVRAKNLSWDRVFWLDSSPRESLTPEELFSVLKVIWPKTQVVNNPEGGSVVGWQVPHDATDDSTPIEWGGLTQYPPDLDWVRVTKDNVSQHLFQPCRWRDQWGEVEQGMVAGWDVSKGKCLVVHSTGVVMSRDADARVQGGE